MILLLKIVGIVGNKLEAIIKSVDGIGGPNIFLLQTLIIAFITKVRVILYDTFYRTKKSIKFREIKKVL